MASWKIFERHPNASAIAQGLDSLPPHWSLTPVREKRPYRPNWQHETPVSREEIKQGVLNGNRLISNRTGNPYTAYDSGFGLRLGDVSGGLLAIDVDGESAEPLLQAISGGNLPPTVSWTSGKSGRYQLLFQIPDEWRDRVSTFTRAVITEYEQIRTKHNDEGKPEELLEFRYNSMQSVLPPSYHPSTGSYQWINSPEDTEVAFAPNWVLNWLISFADKEKREQEEQEQKRKEREQRKEERKRKRHSDGVIGAKSLEDALEEAVETLDYEDIFSWNGHNFKRHGRKLVGCCPQHESSSGTAFQINPDSKEWYCHGCKKGGHAVQYRYFLNDGNGTPTGQDFIAIARELCEEANVEFPEFESKSESHWVEPPQVEYQAYQRELEQEERIEEAQRERDREQWREKYPIAAKNSYKRLKQFTPDIRINTPLLQKEEIDGLLATDHATCIRSPMATGKTQMLKHLTRPNILKTLTPIKTNGRVGLNPQTQERLEAVEAIKDLRYCLGDEKWRSIGYRNNLLIQSSAEWGMVHLPSAEANGLSTRDIIKEENSKTSSCVDSITTRYNPEDFDGCNLVLDEANALITHLLTAKTEVSKRLDETCELFAEALQRAKRVFILDALLTDDAIAYLQKLAPNKNFIKIQNDYKNPTEITHFVGTEEEIEGEIIVRKNKRNPLVELMLSAERPVVCSDSQLFCAAMEHIFQKEGKQGIRIDGETSGEEQSKTFLENPDAFIAAHEPDYLIYSPSMESGNSIKTQGYFDEQYSFDFGAIGTDSQHQMMMRLRDRAIKRYVWCKEFDSKSEKLRSPFPRTNLRNHKAMLLLDIQNCFDRGEDVTEKLIALSEMNKECPHDLMFATLESIYSYEKSNLRECLIESLQASGHQITEITLRDLSEDKIESEAKDETKDRYSNDIFNAEDIDSSEIEERKKRGKWKDQCAVSKKVLKLQLPEIETTPHWNPNTIRLLKYDERDRVRQLERYWMLNNLDGARKLQRERWEKVSNGVIHKYHLRSDYSKVLALIEAGIEQFMDSDKEWKADDPEVQQFIKNCQKHDFKLAFGKAPSKKSHPMRWIGTCLDFFGCDWRDRRRRINGDQIRFYRVVSTLRTDMRNPTFYECITNRFNKNLENLNSEKSPETHTTTGVDAESEGGAVFKQYSPFCHTSNHNGSVNHQESEPTEVEVDPKETGSTDSSPPSPSPIFESSDRVLTFAPVNPQPQALPLERYEMGEKVFHRTPFGKWLIGYVAEIKVGKEGKINSLTISLLRTSPGGLEIHDPCNLAKIEEGVA